ncbi:hypothetical protein PEBR_17229 [Penicillium brasilianum]|uniref:Uncharacterized protein n=1 Tax=Penicillium brasilianum TaxID=104259 RepID=A0A1S9RPF5_PENBI|nr:hypothetical protein PEBR_17229 [Penicillium brasilianum]
MTIGTDTQLPEQNGQVLSQDVNTPFTQLIAVADLLLLVLECVLMMPRRMRTILFSSPSIAPTLSLPKSPPRAPLDRKSVMIPVALLPFNSRGPASWILEFCFHTSEWHPFPAQSPVEVCFYGVDARRVYLWP